MYLVAYLLKMELQNSVINQTMSGIDEVCHILLIYHVCLLYGDEGGRITNLTSVSH